MQSLPEVSPPLRSRSSLQHVRHVRGVRHRILRADPRRRQQRGSPVPGHAPRLYAAWAVRLRRNHRSVHCAPPPAAPPCGVRGSARRSSALRSPSRAGGGRERRRARTLVRADITGVVSVRGSVWEASLRSEDQLGQWNGGTIRNGVSREEPPNLYAPLLELLSYLVVIAMQSTSARHCK